MGGRALKTAHTRRYAADEYHRLVPQVVDMIPGRAEVIPAYATKSSFGDMDVIYSNAPVDVEPIFQPTEIVRNGPVTSFDYRELQIDLIYSPNESYAYALNYYSWNDAGNLVGRIMHRMGLKHGHRGLTMPVRVGTRQVAEISLTTDYASALSMIGLEPLDNPQTLEDIFAWVATSRYFSPDIYLFENLNNVSRTRDKKRETYRRFLDWCKDYRGPAHTAPTDALSLVFDHFPESEYLYDQSLARDSANQIRKTKFNGLIVSELTGLTGVQLGIFMAQCIAQIGPELDHMSPDHIRSKILEIHTGH